jgi:hypothetical protein
MRSIVDGVPPNRRTAAYDQRGRGGFLGNASAKSRSTVAAADGNGRRYLAGLYWTEAATRRQRSGIDAL